MPDDIDRESSGKEDDTIESISQAKLKGKNELKSAVAIIASFGFGIWLYALFTD